LGPFGGHWEVVEGRQGNFRCYLPARRTYSGTRGMRIRVGEGENAHYETVCCNEASCSDIRNCIRNSQDRRYLDLFSETIAPCQDNTIALLKGCCFE